MEYIETAYKALSDIYMKGAYLDAAMAKIEISPVATKIIYGVLEKDTQLNFVISSLVKEPPKTSVLVSLKIGAYCLLYMDSIPDYAIVNGVVEFVKKQGKTGVSGFVNAVLKKVARREFKVPTGELEKLAYDTSKPVWFVKKVIKQFGKDAAKEILNEQPFELEHIRNNSRLCTLIQIEKTLSAEAVEYTKSMAGGLNVRNCKAVKNMFSDGAITYQSPSSMTVVQALKPYGNVLDLCAAPGGKTVYAAEMNKGGFVTACDVSDAKVKQIKSYLKRMMITNVETKVNDAAKFNDEFVGKFDCVLVDAPCSCYGTMRKHPDVFLRHDENTIKQMAATQKKILLNAEKYLKKGGTLVYSTCTIFDEENACNVKYILENSALKLDKIDLPFDGAENGTITILPKEEWDGFFIARFVKK
ncbi:MAG: 16S rRNA (cytosine(967)-C(5))-methyltransferase RsmB [Eubacteriales bacterium]|nr:16S rRNA (cytosine(967)-C(5))-methyltransferase RsmB [Eubacteriales bacterium]